MMDDESPPGTNPSEAPRPAKNSDSTVDNKSSDQRETDDQQAESHPANSAKRSTEEPVLASATGKDQSGAEELTADIDMEKSSLGEAASSLLKLFNYSTGIPERTLRSASAIAGAVRESAGWLIPTSFRNSRSYSIFAQQMLDFVVNDIGGVKRASVLGKIESPTAEVDLARRTVGNLLDLTALATFHISPITVLAIFSDVAYESKVYMQQLSERLKEQGIVPRDSKIESGLDLINALEKAVEEGEGAFDKPPLSISGLKSTLHATQAAVATTETADLATADEIDQLWRQMELAAVDQHTSVWDISTTMAMAVLNNIQTTDEGVPPGLDVGEGFFNGQIFALYWEGLRQIERQGLLPTLSDASQPYLEAVWSNFAFDRKTWAEQLLSGELLKWRWSKLSWPKLLREPKDEDE